MIYINKIKLLNEWESYFNNGTNLEEYFVSTTTTKACFVRVWNLGEKQRLCECRVGPDSTEVMLMNTFETHGPNKSKLRAKGSVTL